MLTVTLRAPATLESVAERWQKFEMGVKCSFFQSWAWVGCLGHERFDDPVLIEARRHGELVAMALFNRRRAVWPGLDRLCLGESGRLEWDSMFVEHNGILLAPGEDDVSLRSCLAAVLRMGRRGCALTLSGIETRDLQVADVLGGICIARQTRLAPYVDLAAIAASGGRHFDHLSANTRYQVRRSVRQYAELGPLEVTRAGSAAQAHEFLSALSVLHQSTWTGRGRPGAFANPNFARFHHALIDRTSAVDLLRITAGDQAVGYLLNFRFRGRVYAYQSGLNYAAAAPHAKPGLTCHQLVIERYLTEGMSVYDFLAGDSRYKRSLAANFVQLHWVVLAPKWSLLGVASQLKAGLQGAMRAKIFCAGIVVRDPPRTGISEGGTG